MYDTHLYKHLKTGNLYTVINRDAVDVTNERDGVNVVVYRRREGGQTYVRELTEFNEKFIPTNLAQEAIDIAVKYSGIDGAHHKDWVIDQMVQVLAGNRYEKVVAEAKNGEDGPETYEWNEGIAP